MKRLIIFTGIFIGLLLALLLVSRSEAASYDTGWLDADVFATSGTGVAFTNPGNAISSNNAYAQSNINNTNQITQLLSAKDYDMAIPTGMNITGIQVRFERRRGLSTSGAGINDYQVQLIGCTGTSFSYNSNSWPTTDAYQVYGSDGFLWDLDCTPADLNSTAFGFGVRGTFYDNGCASYPCSTRAQVDHMQVKVFYQDPPTISTKLKQWLMAPFLLGAQAAGCTFTVVDATTTSAWCDTSTSTTPISNPTNDAYLGLLLFFGSFAAIIWALTRRKN